MIALLCLTSLILPATGVAETAVVGIDHFPPWKLCEHGKAKGIDIELTKALFKEVGVTPDFLEYPWARCLNMLETGQVAFISGILKRPDREIFLTFIEPPYKTHSSKVFYRLRTSRDIKGIEDLTGLTVGIQRGAKFFPEFDNNHSLTKTTVTNDRFNFLKLSKGRIDAVLTTESQGDYMVTILGLQNTIVKSTYRHDAVVPVHFAISKKSYLHRLVPQFHKAARRLCDNGTFNTIILNYYKSLKKTKDQ